MSIGGQIESEPVPPSVHVRVPDDVSRGVYANLVLVSHSEHEFTVDWCQVQHVADAENVPADAVARVHIAPTLVPSLIQTLERNLEAYERQFGGVRPLDRVEARA